MFKSGIILNLKEAVTEKVENGLVSPSLSSQISTLALRTTSTYPLF